MKMTMSEPKILELMNNFLKDATDEEKEVLQSMLEGLKEKQVGNYTTYLAGLTRIKTRTLENGDYEVIMPIQPIVENPLRIVHGGMTATLLDTAMGSMLNKKLPQDKAAVTTEMKINYLKPGIGNQLRCVASIVNQGRQLVVCEAKVYNDNDKLVAIANGTFFVIDHK